MSLPPGTRLAAYEIVAPLGAGGMGEVYRARDPRLGRDVALKILPPSVAQDPVRLERFAREARAVAALNHPHIVTIYSTEEADGVRFLTMELVEGRSLDAVIPAAGLPVGRFLDIAVPLADAIGAAHQKQITHRDLKPGNVMLTHDGRVKVLDFGLARIGEGDAPAAAAATQLLLTHEGTIVGTMPYMSPEQISGEAVDQRSDIFSLGIIFYEMLTGSRPFQGASSPLLISSILRDAPTPLHTVRAEVPEDLSRLVSRCLEKRPDERIQTARDIHSDLRRLQKQFASGAVPRPAAAPPSIAVLPFADLSPDGDQGWFCDGIAEDVLNALAQLTGVRTIARRSSFALRGTADDPREAGRVLDVGHVVTGSIRRAGGQVRVTAQLVAAASGEQLWSQRYDRAVTDLFAIQDEIAREIVHALTGRLLSGTGGRRAPDIAAYEAVLRGRHEMYAVFSPDSWQRARAHFERAVAIDPGYAEAHAQLGLVSFVSGMHGHQPMRAVAAAARASVDRALSLEPADPMSRAVLAAIALAYDYDWATAEGHFTAALAAPNVSAEAHWLHASLFLGALGRFDEAVAEMGRAVEKDPLNANWRAIWSAHLLNAGRTVEARREAERAIAIDAGNWTGHHVRGEALLAAGLVDDALAAIETACRVAPWSQRSTLLLAAFKHRSGEADAARRLLASVGEQVQPWARAQYHLLAGELDAAADWYERMIAQRDPFALVYANAPLMRPLHQHPRWRRIARTLNLPGASRSEPSSDSVRRSVSIAVGTFAARSSDEESRALADGLGEELLAGLSRFPYLSVAGRRSETARYVLEGTARRAGSLLRLVVHLTDTARGTHLWSESYTRDLTTQDIFELQDDLADRLVGTVADPHGVLMRSIVDGVRHRPLDDLQPRDLILRYWSYDHQHTPAEHERLRDALERACGEHPHDADLWAAVSRIASQEFMFSLNPRPDPLGRALAAANRAVQLDPAGQFGWEALAIALFFSRDREGFIAAAERALSLNARNANTLAWMASLYGHLGDIERSESLIQRAFTLNSQHPGWYYFPVYMGQASRGDWAGALQTAKKINMPGHVFVPMVTAQACLALGRVEEARAAFAELRAIAPDLAADRAALEAHLEKWAWATGRHRDYAALVWKANDAEPASGSATTARKGILVLPFANIGGSQDDEYFADGLTEEVIADLSRLPGLKVISRSSSLRLKGTLKDIRALARELDVSHVVEGSVRKAGPHLRITVQLVDALSDRPVWGEKFSGRVDEIFDLQERVAREIARTLDVTVSSGEARVLSARRRDDPAVYEAAMRARHEIRRASPESIARALSIIGAAQQDHPGDATLNGLRVYAETMHLRSGVPVTPELLDGLERQAADVFAALPDSVVGHFTLGYVAFERGDQERAVRHLTRAVQIQPDTDALMFLAIAYLYAGRTVPAREIGRRLLAIDPLVAVGWIVDSVCDWFEGRFAEGMPSIDRAVELEASSALIRWHRAYLNLLAGRPDESAVDVEIIQRDAPDHPFTRHILSLLSSARGDRAAALEWLAPLRSVEYDHHWSFHIGEAAAVAGDVDYGLAMMERGVTHGFYPYGFIAAHNPFLRRLEGDARFTRIVEEARRRHEAMEA